MMRSTCNLRLPSTGTAPYRAFAPAHRCTIFKGHRRSRSLHCRYILQQEDPKQSLPQISTRRLEQEQLIAALQQELQRELLRIDSLNVEDKGKPLSRDVLPETEYTWHFAYGANMAFPTLSKRGVKVGSRDPARVVNDNIRMVFKHRGGMRK